MKNATTILPAVIVVEVDRRTERYTRLEEAVPFLKELAGPVVVSRKEFNKARRMLGAALLQLRRQTEHGAWGAFRSDLAARLDLNEHTLRNCIKVAEKLLTKRGNISPAKVREAANVHGRVDLPPASALSMCQLEELAGVRTMPGKRTAEEIHAEMEAELNGGRHGGTENTEDAMGEFASVGSGFMRPVTISTLQQERGRVDFATPHVISAGVRGEQLTLDGLYAEARTLIENVSSMPMAPEKRSKVDELTRDYMKRLRALVAIDVVA